MSSSQFHLKPNSSLLMSLYYSRISAGLQLGGLSLCPLNLFWINIKNDLSLQAHVAKVSKTSFWQLKILKSLLPFTEDTFHTSVVNSLIQSKLEYGNTIYLFSADLFFQHLQLVQRAAACLIMNMPTGAHRFPLSQVTFKSMIIVNRALYQQSLDFLARDRPFSVAAVKPWNTLPVYLHALSI